MLARDLSRASEPLKVTELAACLAGCGELLGLLQAAPLAWLNLEVVSKSVDTDQVESLIAARNAARDARDFAEADRIRDQLAELGVALEDGADGTRWTLARG